uniref:Uncharacterized protein n=1 Tax=Picea sitchensis TaxID=3332 RepID=D5A977_PICSI|nr:unknown [Picea sitchensis]
MGLVFCSCFLVFPFIAAVPICLFYFSAFAACTGFVMGLVFCFVSWYFPSFHCCCTLAWPDGQCM